MLGVQFFDGAVLGGAIWMHCVGTAASIVERSPLSSLCAPRAGAPWAPRGSTPNIYLTITLSPSVRPSCLLFFCAFPVILFFFIFLCSCPVLLDNYDEGDHSSGMNRELVHSYIRKGNSAKKESGRSKKKSGGSEKKSGGSKKEAGCTKRERESQEEVCAR